MITNLMLVEKKIKTFLNIYKIIFYYLSRKFVNIYQIIYNYLSRLLVNILFKIIQDI